MCLPFLRIILSFSQPSFQISPSVILFHYLNLLSLERLACAVFQYVHDYRQNQGRTLLPGAYIASTFSLGVGGGGGGKGCNVGLLPTNMWPVGIADRL